MREIRLRWNPEVVHEEKYQIRNSGDWLMDAVGIRRDLETICRTANEIYGQGTHWLEERETPFALTPRSLGKQRMHSEGETGETDYPHVGQRASAVGN